MAPTTTFLRLSDYSVVPVRVFVNKRSIAHSLSSIAPSESSNGSGNGVFFQTIVPISNSSKSMIRLKRSNKIRLSNNDLNKVISIFSNSLKDVFFRLSYDEIEAMSMLSKSYRKNKNAQNKRNQKSNNQAIVDVEKEQSDSGGDDNNNYYVQNASNLRQTKDQYIIPLSAQGWKIHLILDKVQIELIRAIIARHNDFFHLSQAMRSDYRYGNYTKLLTKQTEFIFPKKKSEEEESTIPAENGEQNGFTFGEEASDSEILASLQNREAAPAVNSGIADAQEDISAGDTKKAKSVLKYKKLNIIGRGVNIYVLRRP